MTLDNLFLYGPLAASALLFGYGLITFALKLGDRASGRVRRRLEMTTHDAAIRASVREGVREGGIARADSGPSRSGLGSLQAMVTTAGVGVGPSGLLGIVGGVAGGLFALQVLFVPLIPTLAALVLSAVIAFSGMLIWLRGLAKKRVKQIETQFPDALDLMVRALKIGLPLSATMEVVAKDMPLPISGEFRQVFEEVNYGKSLNDALSHLCERVPLDDLRYFAVAVQIQNETGGNLSEILSGLAAIIRERFRLFRKVQSITTEGRMSAWFLTGFPIAIAGIIQLIKPDYYTQLAGEPFFYPVAFVVLALLVMNFVAMKVITAIKV